MSDTIPVTQPTSEECSARKRWRLPDGRLAMATWYPQMGGYVGRAVVVTEPDAEDAAPCFDVYVWHNGEFPFDSNEYPEREPAHLHHCIADQFRRFADEVEELQAEPAT